MDAICVNIGLRSFLPRHQLFPSLRVNGRVTVLSELRQLRDVEKCYSCLHPSQNISYDSRDLKARTRTPECPAFD